MAFCFLATARSPPPGCRPGGVCDEAMGENELEIAHGLVSFASLLSRIVTDYGGP
jgi:hypothetical protein